MKTESVETFIGFEKSAIEQSLGDRFEQQVRRYPDRVAIKSRRHLFTYDDLNKIANRVARAVLAARGIGEEPIGLVFEPDAPAIVAMLGVLKAGKAYVPLDASHPRARIINILEDSQAGLIVTNEKNLALAREVAGSARQLINIDEIDSSLTGDNIGLLIRPDALATILHTSGSTGRPKGVMQTHRNVLHSAWWHTTTLHLGPDDRLALLYSHSIAAAIVVIFDALLTGAAAFIFDLKEEGLAGLANWMIQEGITIYKSVPTVFRHFVGTLSGRETFPTLRLISLGGESVYKRDVDLYKNHFPESCRFHVRLASSETILIREQFIDRDTPVSDARVPVGYAVEDKEVLLLDDRGQPVGVNQIGEIAVKSRYLSPGYWRKPELTRAAFLPDPAGTGERIYRTGDLGRLRSDGCLEYLGRNDLRVKVRGYRVEIVEIEAALLDLDAIKATAVVAQENEHGDVRLVAYLVPAAPPAPTPDDLRRALSQTLPDYMIPSAFVMLDSLPLTLSGKIDRQALPIPDSSRLAMAKPFVAPRTSVEKVLAGIWAEVLGLDEIGIHDNFFTLGGHSLLATGVMSQINAAFSVELPLRSLFEASTVERFAARLIHDSGQPAIIERTAQLLLDLVLLSEEEAAEKLEERASRPPEVQADEPAWEHARIQKIIDAVSKSRRDLYFIQIGASDGVTRDPIRAFVLRDGWAGILIEPVPYVFDRLMANYQGQENLIFENVAISDRNGFRDFWYLRETSDDLPAWYTVLGSFKPDIILSFNFAIPNIRDYLVKEKVRCITFDTLVRKHSVERIDFLVINAQGYDFEILKQIDFGRYDIPMLLYEHAQLGESDREACESYLRSQGYRLIQDELDTIAFKDRIEE